MKQMNNTYKFSKEHLVYELLIIMPKSKKEEPSDTLRCFAYATLMSVAAEKGVIDGDELFLGIYLFLKEKEFSPLLRKYVGINDTSVLQTYVDTVYML